MSKSSAMLAACGALALCLSAVVAQAGSLEPVASFHEGQIHLDLEVFHASDGSRMGLLTIENPLRIRGLPTASVALQPRQWPELIAVWAKARAAVTGSEAWTPIGEVVEIDGSPFPARLTISAGPDVRFAMGGAGGAITFELSAADVEAMEQALAREQAMLDKGNSAASVARDGHHVVHRRIP